MTGEQGHSMIDHISVGVSDLERWRGSMNRHSPLGLSPRHPSATIGFCKTYPEFWINLRAGMARSRPRAAHICLRAKGPAMSMRAMPPRSAPAALDGAPGFGRMIASNITRLRHRSRRQPHRGGDIPGE
jgi:hypothetical protein